MGSAAYQTNNIVNKRVAAAKLAREAAASSIASPFASSNPFPSTIDQPDLVPTTAPAPLTGLAAIAQLMEGKSEQEQASIKEYLNLQNAKNQADPAPAAVPAHLQNLDSNRWLPTGRTSAGSYSSYTDAQKKEVEERKAAKEKLAEQGREAARTANPNFSIVDSYAASAASHNPTKEDVRNVLNDYDPNRGGLMGTSTQGFLRDKAVIQPFVESIRTHKVPLAKKNDTPISIDYDHDYDADNLYMKLPPTTGKSDLTQGFTLDEQERRRDLENRGSFVDISGGNSKVGEYSMLWVEDPPDIDQMERVTNHPVVQIAAALVPYGTLVLNGIKAIDGQTLHGLDYAGSVISGLEGFGVINAGSDAVEAVDAVEATATSAAIPAVEAVPAVAEVGLGGLSYAQTTGLITAAATGDLKDAIIGYVTPLVTNKVREFVNISGIPADADGRWNGMQVDDLEKGLNKSIDKYISGASAEDALKSGFVTYIKEGGSLGNFSSDDFTGDFPDLGIDFSYLTGMVKDLGDKAKTAYDTVSNLVDDKLIQPIKNSIPQSLIDDIKAAEAQLRETGRDIDREVLQELLAKGREFDDAVLEPMGDAAKDAGVAIKDLLSGVNLPSIGLPSLGLGGLGLGGSGLLQRGASAPSSTRTTDDLFKNELFKFKEEEPLLALEDNLEYIDFTSDPFGDTLQQRYPI